MKTLIRALALLIGATPVFAGAQTFDEYLQLRKRLGISRVTDVETVETFVGKKIMEVSGTVKGLIGSGDTELILIEGPGGVQHYIHTISTPEWMKHGQVQARLIVDAERRAESTMLEATLLGAATESEVLAYEAKVAKPKATVKPPTRVSGSKFSRKGGRPGPLPGDVPKYSVTPVASSPQLTEELLKALPSYTKFVQGRNKKLSPDEAQRIAENILAYSAHFGVDARLIVAIIITESDFDPNTTSHAGAMGLGQLMPVNVRELGLNDGYNIEQNLWGTVKLVRGHIDKYSKQTDDSFEALVLALAGYNAGNGAVKKYGGVPPYKETQDYVRKVIDRYCELCGQ